MTKKQKRMANIIRQFQRYAATYSPEQNADLSDAGFIKNMLYGVGIAIESSAFQFAEGFDKFMVQLRETVIPAKCASCDGTGDSRKIPHPEGTAWNRTDTACKICHGSGLIHRLAKSPATQEAPQK